ncbi:MAG: archaeal heat shock protein Hsp20 [Candidatus Bathyarchaeia archaeon]
MPTFWDDWFEKFWRRRGSFFFPDIERMIEEMEKEMADAFKNLEEIVPREMIRERRLPDGSIRREYGPFVYGYSVKIGPDGRPIIREFGNIKPGPGRHPLNLQDQREPLVDIIEEDETVKVIAELPGVEKKDIQLYATNRTLTIHVDTPTRKYHKRLELPAEIDESTARSTYRNGVLETTLKKKKTRGEGAPIKIE